MDKRLRHACYLILERALTWCVNPYWRAVLLRWLGAEVGRNVRVYEARFFNLAEGFRNLVIEDDAHVGTGCLLDLSDRVVIKTGATLSPRVTVLTHSDPGKHHGSPLVAVFPVKRAATVIGEGAWIGACATILAGSSIGAHGVVGANALVTHDVLPRTVVAGAPAKPLRHIEIESH